MNQAKKVDESWKDAVQKEKQVPPTQSNAPAEEPALDFMAFVSTLAMQSLMAMGEIAHPQTQERHRDLTQARYLIDALQLLSDKTKGNLTPEESKEFTGLLYELRVKFVKATQETA